jgi:hypothetical protein
VRVRRHAAILTLSSGARNARARYRIESRPHRSRARIEAPRAPRSAQPMRPGDLGRPSIESATKRGYEAPELSVGAAEPPASPSPQPIPHFGKATRTSPLTDPGSPAKFRAERWPSGHGLPSPVSLRSPTSPKAVLAASLLRAAGRGRRDTSHRDCSAIRARSRGAHT